MKETLFASSLRMHQILLNCIADHEDGEGICHVLMGELILKTERSQTWVNQAIERINVEDQCIEWIGKDTYRVHYKNLREKGVFAKVEMLLNEASKDSDLINQRDDFIAQQYDITLKTVRMFKTYMRAGWPTPEDKPERKPKKTPKWFLDALNN